MTDVDGGAVSPRELSGDLLDRRVAHHLGYRWFTATVIQVDSAHRGQSVTLFMSPEKLAREHEVEYYDMQPCEPAWDRIGRGDHPPEFSKDVQALGKVIHDIEKRGWIWSVQPSEPKKYASSVSGGTYRCSTAPYGFGCSDVWAEALCRAYVEACEYGSSVDT
jgi:hypothetical protein